MGPLWFNCSYISNHSGPTTWAPSGAPKGPVAITSGSQSIMHLTRLNPASLGLSWISWKSRISKLLWTGKPQFCSLQAQRSITRPATPIDQIWPQTPFLDSKLAKFPPIFARIGPNSAPEPPNELKTGLSIVISAPLSVSEHQMARNLLQNWPTRSFPKNQKIIKFKKKYKKKQKIEI